MKTCLAEPRRKGFTLIEMVVVVAILAAMSAIIWQIFIHSHKTFYIEQSQTNLQLDARSSVDEIVNQIKKTSFCLSSYTTGSTTFTASANSDSATLILKTLSIDAAGNNLAALYDYFIFRRDPQNQSNLQEIVFANPSSARKSKTKTLNHKTSSFSLKYQDKDGTILTSNFENASMVKAKVNAEEIVYNRKNQATFTSSGYLRNF